MLMAKGAATKAGALLWICL